MSEEFSHSILEDAEELAGFLGWERHVYEDFLAIQRGELSEEAFWKKYRWRRAILSLDMTDYTSASMRVGELESLLRILTASRSACRNYRSSTPPSFAAPSTISKSSTYLASSTA